MIELFNLGDFGRVLLSVLATVSLVLLGAVMVIVGMLRLLGLSPTDVVPITGAAGAAARAIGGR